MFARKLIKQQGAEEVVVIGAKVHVPPPRMCQRKCPAITSCPSGYKLKRGRCCNRCVPLNLQNRVRLGLEVDAIADEDNNLCEGCR